MDEQNTLEKYNDLNQTPSLSLQSQNGEKGGIKKLFNKRNDLLLLAGILFLLAVVFAGLTYSRGSNVLDRISPLSKDNKFEKAANEKNIQNPITGVMYSSSESEAWVNVRPMGVMVNNHVDARPQSGLIYADLVYEIVAEGGITRFLAFYLSETPEKLGPIRSTREYYLVLVKEMGDAMLMHWGYSPQALTAIETWPVRSLQRGGVDQYTWRDNPRDVATEHTLYADGKKLRERGDELGWHGKKEFTIWKFKNSSTPPAPTEGSCFVGECKPITIDFWYEGDYSSIWNYNKDTNEYLRFAGYDTNGTPIPHVDQETKEQVKVKNLIVQFAVENSIVGDDKSRLEYELVGSGEGLVFMDGAVINVTWKKEDRDSRTVFFDETGKEVEFNRGKFWVSLVPARNKDQVAF